MSDSIPRAGTGEDALEAAVREHARMVYRIAYSVLRNHHDAEDYTQETFVRVLKYRRNLENVRRRDNSAPGTADRRLTRTTP